MSHQNTDQYMLRLPAGWRGTLKDLAKKNHRTLNSEILAALESVVRAAGGEIGVQAPAASNNNTALASGASITNG